MCERESGSEEDAVRFWCILRPRDVVGGVLTAVRNLAICASFFFLFL